MVSFSFLDHRVPGTYKILIVQIPLKGRATWGKFLPFYIGCYIPPVGKVIPTGMF